MAACCDKSTIKEARQMEEVYVGIDMLYKIFYNQFYKIWKATAN